MRTHPEKTRNEKNEERLSPHRADGATGGAHRIEYCGDCPRFASLGLDAQSEGRLRSSFPVDRER
jgi:hypothetical protein